MASVKQVDVKDLALDKHNYRTTPRSTEVAAVHALIAIDTDWFWALMESLLEDGYLPTENILVLQDGKLIVKEGNRRVAALKLIHGHIKRDQFDLPQEIEEKIKSLPASWKQANKQVPCTIYPAAQATAVDRIVTLTHGKGEKAGRAKWKAVARARHARDINGSSQPALDLLEKFLVSGKTANVGQAERWAGDYPLSVLDEAMKKLASRLGKKSSKELAADYPKKVVGYKQALDKLLADIGTELVGFKEVRAANFGVAVYGFPPPPTSSPPTGSTGGVTNGGSSGAAGAGSAGGNSNSSGSQPSDASSGGAGSKKVAYALDDPRSVAESLKVFSPVGANREKVVALRNELRRLKIPDHPYSFCFLLRSIFEISAKAYCEDHKGSGGPSATKSDGTDVPLAQLLKDIVAHLHNNKQDKAMLKLLHGPLMELASHDGILSVTSMNQLVHNPKFGLKPSEISLVFHRVFPLLDKMNS